MLVELKPQDIVVALKLCVVKARDSYAVLGKSLGISASEAHASVCRLPCWPISRDTPTASA